MKLFKLLWEKFLGLFKKSVKTPVRPVKVLEPAELEKGRPTKPTKVGEVRGSEPTGKPRYKRKPEPTKLNQTL